MTAPISNAHSHHFDTYNADSAKVSTQLTHQSLTALCRGEILAIRVPNYYNAAACEQILSHLDANQQLVQPYDNAPELDIYRLGMAFFETRFNQKLLDNYFSLSDPFRQSVEELCSPYLSPLDQLTNDLGELWPAGIINQKLNGKPMMPGLIRVFMENQNFPPHQDLLTHDTPDLPREEHPLSQLAINIYLRNFDEGGELELWDYAPNSEQVKQLYTGAHDFIDRAKIPSSSLKIRPTPGELVIVQCSKLHAVLPGKGNNRVAFSCFNAYRGEDKPLTYWI